jgi:hypothetical protein
MNGQGSGKRFAEGGPPQSVPPWNDSDPPKVNNGDNATEWDAGGDMTGGRESEQGQLVFE